MLGLARLIVGVIATSPIDWDRECHAQDHSPQGVNRTETRFNCN